MGLDMYLYKKIYVGTHSEYNKTSGKISIKKDGKPINININRISEIVEEVGYWRKANQVHKWFVENIQEGVDDCSGYYVSLEKLSELLDICKQIKAACILVDGAVTNGYVFENGVKMPIVEEGKEMRNTKIAKKLLPAASGFFFGSTDYDQYYMDDIDNTIEIIETIMAERDEKGGINGSLYYHSSW